MNIFDDYTAAQLREIFLEPTNCWPDDFIRWVNNELAGDLLDQWLDSHDDGEYRSRIKDIVEDLTYGQEDDDGNEMREFTTQMRLFY